MGRAVLIIITLTIQMGYYVLQVDLMLWAIVVEMQQLIALV